MMHIDELTNSNARDFANAIYATKATGEPDYSLDYKSYGLTSAECLEAIAAIAQDELAADAVRSSSEFVHIALHEAVSLIAKKRDTTCKAVSLDYLSDDPETLESIKILMEIAVEVTARVYYAKQKNLH